MYIPWGIQKCRVYCLTQIFLTYRLEFWANYTSGQVIVIIDMVITKVKLHT